MNYEKFEETRSRKHNRDLNSRPRNIQKNKCVKKS